MMIIVDTSVIHSVYIHVHVHEAIQDQAVHNAVNINELILA